MRDNHIRSRGATTIASFRVWDTPALRTGGHLQKGQAESGLLQTLNKSSGAFSEVCYIARAKAPPVTRASVRVPAWHNLLSVGWAATQPFCFEIT